MKHLVKLLFIVAAVLICNSAFAVKSDQCAAITDKRKAYICYRFYVLDLGGHLYRVDLNEIVFEHWHGHDGSLVFKNGHKIDLPDIDEIVVARSYYYNFLQNNPEFYLSK